MTDSVLPNAIFVDAVSKTYSIKDRSELVLSDISMEVPAGSFTSVIGPSGCGKSTLLKVMSGLVVPTTGEVRVGSLTAEDAVRDRQIGLVFQDPVLLPWLDAADNAALLREIAIGRRHRRDAKVHALDLLTSLGLRDAANKKPSELSGGMRQRVAIARALALDPSVLLMDEPFAALDAITRDQLNNMLMDLWSISKKTVVFVTHSISEALYLSDTIHVMGTRPGRIVESIEVDLPRPRGPSTFEAARFSHLEQKLRALLIPQDRTEIPDD